MRALASSLVIALLAGCGSTSSPPEDDAAIARADGGIDAAVISVDAGATEAAVDAASVDAAPVDASLPDGSLCVASGACDPFDETSCGAMACRPGATGTACSALSATPLGINMACVHAADCAPGLVCLSFAPAEGSLCHQMCPTRSVGDCPTGFACIGSFGDTCINLCRPLAASCDIYAQDCPMSADTCTLVRNPETSAPFTGCRPAGTQTEGMACGGTDGTCSHALICVGTAGIATCRHVCDSTLTPDTCASPAMCTGLATTWGVHFCQ